MKKLIILSFLGLTLLATACQSVDEVQETSTQSNDTDELFVFEETEFDFGVIKQSGGIVEHDFDFTYVGEEPISITSTPGSCACTTAEISQNEFQPGESGVLTVYFHPNLHAEPEGHFFKSVLIMTDPSISPAPEVKVWQEIDLDLGEEFFELQAPHEDDGHGHDEVSVEPSVPAFVERSSREIAMEAVELIDELDDGMEYQYFTYNGTVPGPFLRAKVGDEVTFTLKNAEDNVNVHSIDLHAVNGPGGGATETQVYPGEEKTFTFEALNPGIYVYHCASPEVADHVANGMYGLILVEPEEGLVPVDREYYVMQGEFYPILTRGETGLTQLSGEKMEEEDPEYIVFNGTFDSLMAENALTANVGETVRLYVGNGGVAKSSNFHVIGEIFDTVYPEGGTPVINNVQTTNVPAGGATIVEFTLDQPGTYKLVDHALSRLEKGALGELIVQ